jgi:hypothetical protein
VVFFVPHGSLGFAPLTQQDPEQQSSPQQTQQPSATGQTNIPESKKPDSTAAPVSPSKNRGKRTAPPGSRSPSKKVVRNGSTVDPPAQLAPAQGQGQSSQQAQSTTQLLASVDDNLKKIASRQLSQNQQDSVKQIRLYMDQAKTAETAGDLDRAHNLAVKAHLLADDLIRH